MTMTPKLCRILVVSTLKMVVFIESYVQVFIFSQSNETFQEVAWMAVLSLVLEDSQTFYIFGNYLEIVYRHCYFKKLEQTCYYVKKIDNVTITTSDDQLQ